MQYASGILKPDCLRRNLSEKVLREIEDGGFKIVYTKQLRLTPSEVDVIYAICREEDFYNGLVEDYTSGDVIFYVVEGEDAINKLSDLVGYREPHQAESHTIRHRYGVDIRDNTIHSTANEETFWKEMELFFTEEEMSTLFPGVEKRQLVGQAV